MAVRARRAAVTDQRAELVPADPDGVGALVTNKGTVDCDVGGDDVAAGAGYLLEAGDSIPVDLPPGDNLYAVCAAGQSTTLHVLRVGAR